MDLNKLYAVVDDGYRTTVKAALISNRYPLFLTERELYISGLSVLEGDLKDVPTYSDTLNIDGLSVVSGTLISKEIPVVTEVQTARVGQMRVVSGSLVRFVDLVSTQTESQSVQTGQLSIISGSLDVVALNAPEQTEVQTARVGQMRIVSGTLI